MHTYITCYQEKELQTLRLELIWGSTPLLDIELLASIANMDVIITIWPIKKQLLPPI